VSSFAVGDIVESVENKTVLIVICSITVAFSAFSWFLVKEPEDEQTDNPVLNESDAGETGKKSPES
jgi:capsular polysaccharide biosynthesis protein